MINKYRSGFSLIEVLIFTTILSLFFVTAAAVVTASLRNVQISQHKILATRYAEELLEWVKNEKQNDWYSFFQSRAGIENTNYIYCFNNTVLAWPAAGSCSTPGLTPPIYNRTLTLRSSDGGSKIEVTIDVGWTDFNISQSVDLKSVMTVYEN